MKEFIIGACGSGIQDRPEIPNGVHYREPGILYGWGWHTASRILLGEGTPQEEVFRPARCFSAISGTLGVTLYLGGRDQINPTWGLALGKVLGESAGINYQVWAGFQYALQ